MPLILVICFTYTLIFRLHPPSQLAGRLLAFISWSMQRSTFCLCRYHLPLNQDQTTRGLERVVVADQNFEAGFRSAGFRCVPLWYTAPVCLEACSDVHNSVLPGDRPGIT